MNQSQVLDEFADIRPFHDSEVPEVMARLMDSPELANTLLGIKFPRLSKWFGWALRPFLRLMLHREFDAIRCIKDLQVLIGEQMEKMLTSSNTPFTVSGLDQLDSDKAYLFISNHRDIAMDPAFVNLALKREGRETVRIAIGDNLLTKPFASDLMRVNKSFIVKRSVTGRREKFTALTTLSRYIRHSLLNDGSHIWIAQREGRAKNGLDRTDTALIKMLSLGRDREQSFGEAMDQVNVVPVAISYMFDPCDRDKARELYQRQTTGQYQKAQHEDLMSIYKGIVGYKGAVHLAFGTVISGCADDEAMAAEVDRQVLTNYHLHPTNLIAWDRLHAPNPKVSQLKAKMNCNWKACEQELLARVEGEQEGVKAIFLAMYANPVQSHLDMVAAGEALGQTQ